MTDAEQMIEQAKAAGFTVYGPEKLTSYFYITDGQRVGYCQADRLRGPTFSTVHKANRQNGTGYHADSMTEALQHKPAWAANDGLPAPKYKDAADFLAQHWQPLKQY